MITSQSRFRIPAGTRKAIEQEIGRLSAFRNRSAQENELLLKLRSLVEMDNGKPYGAVADAAARTQRTLANWRKDLQQRGKKVVFPAEIKPLNLYLFWEMVAHTAFDNHHHSLEISTSELQELLVRTFPGEKTHTILPFSTSAGVYLEQLNRIFPHLVRRSSKRTATQRSRWMLTRPENSGEVFQAFCERFAPRIPQ